MIRQKISQAEIDLYSDILAGLVWRPIFLVIVIIDDRELAIERARTTLLSVFRQGYPDWHIALIGDEPAVALRDRLVDGRDTIRTLCERLPHRMGDWESVSARVLEGFDAFRGRIEVLAPGCRDRLDHLAKLAGTQLRPVFLGPLVAGDELGCDAFLELAVTSGMHRDCDFFYGDEQRLDPLTGACEEFLKPQWSPDLLLSTNYIGRYWCASRGLLERVAATLPDLLTLGEYEIVLRCTEQSRGIRHVPSVLCRSTARGLDSEAGMKRSLTRACERRGIDGEIVSGGRPGFYRLKRRLIADELVSIILATCGARDLIRTCIDTLRNKTAYRNFEIICVDNIPAADHRSKDWLRANADTVIETERRFNWSYFNNRGAALAAGPILLFLNDDIEIIDPGWLDALIEHVQRPEVGVVGARLLYPNRSVQHGGMFLAQHGLSQNSAPSGQGRHAFRHRRHDDPGYFGLALTQRNVTAVTGACLMTRRETFLDLGGFNEGHDILNNDLDYCLRARSRGLLCVYTPHAKLVHHEGGSRPPGMTDHYDHEAFSRAWWPLFGGGDPYHHPRLSKEIEDIVAEPEPAEVVCVARPLFTREAVRKILVVALDHMSGCIAAIPAIRRLRHVFPRALIHVLGGCWSEAIWTQVTGVDAFIAFDFSPVRPQAMRQRLGEDDFRQLRQRLEPYRFDLAIDFCKHGDTRPILQCAGARYFAGFGQNSEFPWLDIAVEREEATRGVASRRHFSDDLVSLVEAVEAETEGGRDLLAGWYADLPRPALSELLESSDRPLVCVHPAADHEIQQWPSAYFAELIDLLVEQDGVHVAIVGLAGESEIARAVLEAVRNCKRVSNLTERLEFPELVGLLSHAALLVGNNSGLEHLAAGLGVPTMVIHAANVDPREWGPLGPRAVAVWRRVHCSLCQFAKPEQCDRNLACLTGLRPVDVYPSCKRLLAMQFGGNRVHRSRDADQFSEVARIRGFGEDGLG